MHRRARSTLQMRLFGEESAPPKVTRVKPGRHNLFCPKCGRKSAYYKAKREESSYRCSRCGWYAFTQTQDALDALRLRALRANNPDEHWDD
jgi:hypothetical protein